MPTFEEVARANVPAEVAAGGSNAVEQYVADWTDWAASGGADSVEHMQNSMVAAQISAGETPAQASTDTGGAPTYSGTDSGWVTAYESNDYSGTPGYAAPARPVAGATSVVNPFFETLTPIAGYDYTNDLYKVPTDGGTAPTPESINQAFEMYFNRPADMPGIQGYMSSGKSIEEIRADLAYQSLYAPETSLAPNAQYYEAPSQDQLGYIQSLGGGKPTSERADTFTYTVPIFTEQDVYEMYDRLGYPPTAADIEYWTKVYPTSPDVRFSPNPRLHIVNAILAGSGLPEYQYLKEGKGVELTGNEPFSYAGSPRSPSDIAGAPYVDYTTGDSGTQAPFGGYFSQGFNPFDYTNIAPTPLTYQGPVPLGAPVFQDAMTNLSAVQNVDAEIAGEPAGDQGIEAALPT